MSSSADNFERNLTADLAPLNEELDRLFAPERRVLAVGLAEKVSQRLPRPAAPLVLAVRVLAAVVLVGVLACAALAAALVAASGGILTRELIFQLTSGMAAVVVALFFNAAAPRLAGLDSRILSRLLGRPVRPGLADVLIVRAGAVLIAVAGAAALW